MRRRAVDVVRGHDPVPVRQVSLHSDGRSEARELAGNLNARNSRGRVVEGIHDLLGETGVLERLLGIDYASAMGDLIPEVAKVAERLRGGCRDRPTLLQIIDEPIGGRRARCAIERGHQGVPDRSIVDRVLDVHPALKHQADGRVLRKQQVVVRNRRRNRSWRVR